MEDTSLDDVRVRAAVVYLNRPTLVTLEPLAFPSVVFFLNVCVPAVDGRGKGRGALAIVS